MLNLDAKKIGKLQALAGDLAAGAARENLPALLRDLEQQLRIDPSAGRMDLNLRLTVELSGCGAWSFSSDASWAIRNRRSGVGDSSGVDFGQPELPGMGLDEEEREPEAEGVKVAESAAITAPPPGIGGEKTFAQCSYELQKILSAAGFSRSEGQKFCDKVAGDFGLRKWSDTRSIDDYEKLINAVSMNIEMMMLHEARG